MTIEARFHVARDDFTLDVDLGVPAQGVTALFGPSGSGKTMLLRAIAGLDHHPGGRLKVGAATWQEADRFVPPHLRSLGYVSQEAALFSHLTVRRNIEYGLKRVPETERTVSFEQAVDHVGIGRLLDRKPGRLSGGERQRVAIARALAVSPRLLLMDEPLASLDMNRKQEILPTIEALHGALRIPVIYVSHSLDEVTRLADHLVLLEAGRVRGSGAIGDMLTRLDLPLAHTRDAEAILEATVAGHDEQDHLTYLDCAAGRFTVVGKAHAIGRAVRLRIAARDVSLTLEPATHTSILNIFPATVDGIVPEGEAQVTVRLLVGGEPMLSRITRKSAGHLGLVPGTAVYAQVKSAALVT